MSLDAQEKILLALLFDKNFRAEFFQNKKQSLQAFALSATEVDDFLVIREDGLEFDAQLRIELILSPIAKQMPLTFSLLSSFENGFSKLRDFINLAFITQPLDKRLSYFAATLEKVFLTLEYQSEEDAKCCYAIMRCEIERLFKAELLLSQRSVINKTAVFITDETKLHNPLILCSTVSVSLLPLSFSELQRFLKVKNVDNVWHDLQKSPLTVHERMHVLTLNEPRLLLTKAEMSYQSAIETNVSYHTVELSEGFAPLMSYINGEFTLHYILNELQSAGADQALLKTLQLRFIDLIDQRFIECVS